MTNQTIDGVPRELLEASWAALMQKGQVLKALQLRDLLDAPAPIPAPVAWMRFDDDQRAIFTRSKRANNSEALYAHPTAYRHTAAAAQPQGEPVAVELPEPFWPGYVEEVDKGVYFTSNLYSENQVANILEALGVQYTKKA